MPLVSQALELYAGTSEIFALQLTALDSVTPLDLSAVTDLVILFKRAYADPDAGAAISKALQVTTITLSGGPTGGTWTATVGGQTTAGIAHDASATEVKTAIEALSSVGAGKSFVFGGPGPTTPYGVVLLNAAAGQPITTSGSGLTGGTSPAAASTTVGAITITDAVHGAITLPFVPTDTNNLIGANTTLFWHAKVFSGAVGERIGAAGTLLVDRAAVQRI